MKRLLITLILAILLAACAPEPQADPRDAYYKGIYDYCVNVTIVDATTGAQIDRDEAYCSTLIADYRARGFYEKYNTFKSPEIEG